MERQTWWDELKALLQRHLYSCPNKIKMYNASMIGVDFIDQETAAYWLDCKSKFRFYLRMFFDLIDIAIVNSHIVYTKLGNSISLLDLEIVVAKSLIGRYSNRQRSFPLSRTSKWKALESSLPKEIPTHMPKFNEKCLRWSFCKNEGADHKKFASCPNCGLYLSCTKERNCFLKHHLYILYSTYFVVLENMWSITVTL